MAVGLKLNGGLDNCGYAGTPGVGKYDTHSVDFSTDPQRYDVVGDMDTAEDIIKNLKAKELFRERAGDIDIIYAYSCMLGRAVDVHGCKVNLMIAVSERGVTLGTPLIYGSY